jgi:hypothetical protein
LIINFLIYIRMGKSINQIVQELSNRSIAS